MNWLFAPENGRAIHSQMIKTANSSKYRPVEIRYLPKKGTSDLITSDVSATCTRTDTRRELTQVLNPTLYVNSLRPQSAMAVANPFNCWDILFGTISSQARKGRFSD